MDIREFVGRLQGAKPAGPGKWNARCPAHGDKNPSMSVSTGHDGKIVLHCHTGCKAEDIVKAVGLELKDLFRDEGRPAKPTIVATYDYHDEKGQLLYQALRYEPKDFRQRRPDGKGGWIGNLQETRRVLYRLPELLAAPKTKAVFIVEGEKDADRLRAMGLVATTSPMGAGKWKQVADHAKAVLKDRLVIVLPDNDQPGRDHARDILQSLSTVARCKVVELPGLPEKGDVSDWLSSGGTLEKLRELTAATEDAPVDLAGINLESFATRLTRERAERQALVRAMVPFEVPFLDDALGGILPTDLILLTARSGAGKTQLAAAISETAARNGRRATVLALEAEEGEYERRIKYRALGKLYRDGVAQRGEDPGIHVSYREWYMGHLDDIWGGFEDSVERALAKDIGDRLHTVYRGADFGIAEIERVMVATQDSTDIYVIDHLHFIDLDDDKSENAAIKAIMKRLRDVSLRLGKPVILVAHLRKADRRASSIMPGLDDIHGSSDIVKICTKVVVMAPAPVDEKNWHFGPTYMQALKDRMDGAPPHVARMIFDKRTGGYGSTYELGRVQTVEGVEQWVALEDGTLPRWAKQEKRNRKDKKGVWMGGGETVLLKDLPGVKY